MRRNIATWAWKFRAFLDSSLSIAHFFMYSTVSVFPWLKKVKKASRVYPYDFHTIGVFCDHSSTSSQPVTSPTSFNLGHMCDEDRIFLPGLSPYFLGAVDLNLLKSTRSSFPVTETANMHPCYAILWKFFIILMGSSVRWRTKLAMILSNL